MCGICGIHEYAQRSPIDPGTLPEMLDTLRHRGPDDDGAILDEGFACGMRRLSIIDLGGGKQPIWNEQRTVAAVVNGEIYNYRELRTELESRGHRFRTGSDTETIVHLYEEHGDDCVQDLRGMFGFAIWDTERRRLLLARDRLGIKPLYYHDSGERLIFASEIKAIVQHPSVDVAPDLRSLGLYLSLKYVPAPMTAFQGIRALEPGHVLTSDANGISVRRYWDLSFAAAQDCGSEEDCAERLEALLTECVRMHLMSDVPFGAFLSGGVDSSTIVALMSNLLNARVRTFAVGYEEAACSELPYARAVAQQYETEHHEVIVRPDHLMDLAPRVAFHLDQPVADPASLPTFMVAEAASQHVKMVLTGEGGDELFAGYARYAGERWTPSFQRLPSPVRRLARHAQRLPGLRRPKVALHALTEANEAARFAKWFPLFNGEMMASLISPEFATVMKPGNASDVFSEHLSRTDATDPLHRMLYLDTKLWLVDDLLARGDKMTMANSIEGRVPLLDHKLVEFAASLPPDMKLRGNNRKYLLKKIARKWLPREIVDRKKAGFPTPYSAWFRKEARPFVRDLLSQSRLRTRGLLQPRYVEQLLTEHERGVADHFLLIWGLLNLELWYSVFIDKAGVAGWDAKRRSTARPALLLAS